MTDDDFIASMDSASYPPALDSYQQALWYQAKGVDWNREYWHAQAGTEYPEHFLLEEE